jgi:hypothetical protein
MAVPGPRDGEVKEMTLKQRLDKLERGLRVLDRSCPNHYRTVVVTDGEPMPEKSAIPLCPHCGQPGAVLVIEEVIVNSRGGIETNPQP